MLPPGRIRLIFGIHTVSLHFTNLLHNLLIPFSPKLSRSVLLQGFLPYHAHALKLGQCMAIVTMTLEALRPDLGDSTPLCNKEFI